MEIKRALFWYLVVLVAMACGVYLGLEIFVNRHSVPESDEQAITAGEEAAGEDLPMFGTQPGDRDDQGGASGIRSRDGIEDSGSVSPGEGLETVSPPDLSSASARGSEEAAASPAPSSSLQEPFTVQVAALTTRAKAEEMVGKLKSDGFASARIVTDQGDNLNRIWVGSCTGREEAEELAAKLTGKGYNTYVRTKH